MYAQDIYQIVHQEMWQDQQALSDITQILMAAESSHQHDTVQLQLEPPLYAATAHIVSVSQEEGLVRIMVVLPDGFSNLKTNK